MAVAQAAHSHALSPNDYTTWALELGLDPSPGYRSQQTATNPLPKDKKTVYRSLTQIICHIFISPLKDI